MSGEGQARLVFAQLELLRKANIPASFFVPAVAAMLYPDEQRRVFERLDAVDRLIERDEAVRLTLQKQKLGLMQDLLTGRVPVPVHSEPAEAAA